MVILRLLCEVALWEHGNAGSDMSKLHLGDDGAAKMLSDTCYGSS
jgi:hypothetical protein